MPRVHLGPLRDTDIPKMYTKNLKDNQGGKNISTNNLRSRDKIEERQNRENSQDKLSVKSLCLEI